MKVSESVVSCHYHGYGLRIAAKRRQAGTDLLILLHGIGCSKDSFDGVFAAEGFRDFSICAFDFPGHGESSRNLPVDFYTVSACADVTQLLISELMERGEPGYERVYLAGHSMGGAVGVLVAEGMRDIECLVSIDGNLVAEDCGLISRSIAEQSPADFLSEGFMRLLASLQESVRSDFRAWADWCAKADPRAVHEAARSLVEWSDSGKLLDQFNALERKAFMYGDQDDKQYLLRQIPRALSLSVSNSGHFMMVDNPDSFYQQLWRTLHTQGFSEELVSTHD